MDSEFYRRIQPSGTGSFSINMPKRFMQNLKLSVGSYVRCTCDGKIIMIEPLEGHRGK